MYFYIYWDGQLVGSVIARDEAEALSRAAEKFGPIWGTVFTAKPLLFGRRTVWIGEKGGQHGDRTAERAL